MARAVVSRLLHEPTVRLKDRGSYHYLHTLRELFGLDPAAPRGGSRRGGHPPGRAPPSGVIRLGTRGSALALAQATLGGRATGRRGRAGHDHDLRATAARTTDKSRFVKEIEEALLAGEIDLAVHSAKDVPGELPAGLSIVGVPERADPYDALCGAASLDALRGRAPWSGRPACAGAPSCSPCAPTSTCASCAATWTRACGGSPTATSTRSCSRAPAWSGSGAAREGEPLPELVPGPGQGCLALEARAGDAAAAAAAAA